MHKALNNHDNIDLIEGRLILKTVLVASKPSLSTANILNGCAQHPGSTNL